MRILVVHRHPNLAEVLSASLRYEGDQVLTVADGREGLERVREGSFDLVLLSTQLPGLDGFEVCRCLRATSDIPILMLALQNGVADQVRGLDLGADDYVVEPVDLNELLARIRAVLRRHGAEQMRAANPMTDIALDRERRSAQRAGRRISLTAKEFELLELLISQPQRVLTRQVIFDRIWKEDFASATNLLDVYICRLRDKLGDRPPRLIKTIWGIGYMWQGER